jgi:hypothetical protein
MEHAREQELQAARAEEGALSTLGEQPDTLREALPSAASSESTVNSLEEAPSPHSDDSAVNADEVFTDSDPDESDNEEMNDFPPYGAAMHAIYSAFPQVQPIRMLDRVHFDSSGAREISNAIRTRFEENVDEINLVTVEQLGLLEPEDGRDDTALDLIGNCRLIYHTMCMKRGTDDAFAVAVFRKFLDLFLRSGPLFFKYSDEDNSYCSSNVIHLVMIASAYDFVSASSDVTDSLFTDETWEWFCRRMAASYCDELSAYSSIFCEEGGWEERTGAARMMTHAYLNALSMCDWNTVRTLISEDMQGEEQLFLSDIMCECVAACPDVGYHAIALCRDFIRRQGGDTDSFLVLNAFLGCFDVCEGVVRVLYRRANARVCDKDNSPSVYLPWQYAGEGDLRVAPLFQHAFQPLASGRADANVVFAAYQKFIKHSASTVVDMKTVNALLSFTAGFGKAAPDFCDNRTDAVPFTAAPGVCTHVPWKAPLACFFEYMLDIGAVKIDLIRESSMAKVDDSTLFYMLYSIIVQRSMHGNRNAYYTRQLITVMPPEGLLGFVANTNWLLTSCMAYNAVMCLQIETHGQTLMKAYSVFKRCNSSLLYSYFNGPMGSFPFSSGRISKILFMCMRKAHAGNFMTLLHRIGTDPMSAHRRVRHDNQVMTLREFYNSLNPNQQMEDRRELERLMLEFKEDTVEAKRARFTRNGVCTEGELEGYAHAHTPGIDRDVATRCPDKPLTDMVQYNDATHVDKELFTDRQYASAVYNKAVSATNLVLVRKLDCPLDFAGAMRLLGTLGLHDANEIVHDTFQFRGQTPENADIWQGMFTGSGTLDAVVEIARALSFHGNNGMTGTEVIDALASAIDRSCYKTVVFRDEADKLQTFPVPALAFLLYCIVYPWQNLKGASQESYERFVNALASMQAPYVLDCLYVVGLLGYNGCGGIVGLHALVEATKIARDSWLDNFCRGMGALSVSPMMDVYYKYPAFFIHLLHTTKGSIMPSRASSKFKTLTHYMNGLVRCKMRHLVDVSSRYSCVSNITHCDYLRDDAARAVIRTELINDVIDHAFLFAVNNSARDFGAEDFFLLVTAFMRATSVCISPIRVYNYSARLRELPCCEGDPSKQTFTDRHVLSMSSGLRGRLGKNQRRCFEMLLLGLIPDVHSAFSIEYAHDKFYYTPLLAFVLSYMRALSLDNMLGAANLGGHVRRNPIPNSIIYLVYKFRHRIIGQCPGVDMIIRGASKLVMENSDNPCVLSAAIVCFALAQKAAGPRDIISNFEETLLRRATTLCVEKGIFFEDVREDLLETDVADVIAEENENGMTVLDVFNHATFILGERVDADLRLKTLPNKREHASVYPRGLTEEHESAVHFRMFMRQANNVVVPQLREP